MARLSCLRLLAPGNSGCRAETNFTGELTARLYLADARPAGEKDPNPAYVSLAREAPVWIHRLGFVPALAQLAEHRRPDDPGPDRGGPAGGLGQGMLMGLMEALPGSPEEEELEKKYSINRSTKSR